MHLLGFVHSAVRQEIGRPFGERGSNAPARAVPLGIIRLARLRPKAATEPQVGTVRDREIDRAVPVLDLDTTAAAELFDVHDESLSASTSALRI
jgi:hypothetical protein